MSDYDVPLPPGFEQEQESDNEEKQGFNCNTI